MARDGTIVIGDKPYTIQYDTPLPAGKRAYEKSFRPSQPTDPGRVGQATWQLGGTPIGASREGSSGVLQTDYALNVDTRFDDVLLPGPAMTALTLTGSDPPGTSTSAVLGGFALGSAPLGGGTGGVSVGNLTHVSEQNTKLIFHRGPYSTQVNTSWTALSTTAHGANVVGAESWSGYTWIGLGATAPMKKLTGITSTSMTFSNVVVSAETIYAGDLRKGNDRLWLVRADTNQARYTLDDFTSIANAFDVGDSGKSLTGIGTLGPMTIFGTLDGVFGFTDAGKPVRVNDALRGHLSPYNGARHASQWGWDYYTTQLGLYAWTPNVSNPVGLEAYDGFEGPIDGRPSAVFAWREYLFCTYVTSAGDSYVIIGKFGPATASTGQPDWYPFLYLSGVTSECVWATSLQTNPTLLVGSGTNAVRVTMGRRGRDIADSNYAFNTSATMQWFGTTMTRNQNLHKYVRNFSLQTEDCTVLNYLQLAVSCDGDSYVNVGNPVNTNGHHVVRPQLGSAPNPNLDFHTIKPRITFTNTSSTTPPLIRGHLVLTYEERPEMLTSVRAVVQVDRSALKALEESVSHDTTVPQAISLPGDNEQHYGFVTDVSPIKDIKGDGVQTAEVTITLWSD